VGGKGVFRYVHTRKVGPGREAQYKGAVGWETQDTGGGYRVGGGKVGIEESGLEMVAISINVMEAEGLGRQHCMSSQTHQHGKPQYDQFVGWQHPVLAPGLQYIPDLVATTWWTQASALCTLLQT
jgi:hypothetical protein